MDFTKYKPKNEFTFKDKVIQYNSINTIFDKLKPTPIEHANSIYEYNHSSILRYHISIFDLPNIHLTEYPVFLIHKEIDDQIAAGQVVEYKLKNNETINTFLTEHINNNVYIFDIYSVAVCDPNTFNFNNIIIIRAYIDFLE
jgi:hypothetical protein